MRFWLASLASLALTGLLLNNSALAAPHSKALKPHAAILLADFEPDIGHHRQFTMVVASAGVKDWKVYLDSQADYRAQDNLAFTLMPNVAPAIEAKMGTPLPEVMIGHRVTVDGVLRRIPIVDKDYVGFVRFNRWGYEVLIDRMSQIKRISP